MMNKLGSAKPRKTRNFRWRVLKFLSLVGGTEGQSTEAACSVLSMWRHSPRTACVGLLQTLGSAYSCLHELSPQRETDRPRRRSRKKTERLLLAGLIVFSHNLGHCFHQIFSIVSTISRLNYFKHKKAHFTSKVPYKYKSWLLDDNHMSSIFTNISSFCSHKILWGGITNMMNTKFKDKRHWLRRCCAWSSDVQD